MSSIEALISDKSMRASQWDRMKWFTSVLALLEMAHFVRAFEQIGFRRGSQCRVHPSSVAWRRFSSLQTESTNKKRVVFLGTPDVAADSLRAIYEESQKMGSRYEIVSVITQPPKRRKRKGSVIASPVGLVAEELGIPVLSPEKAKDPDFLNDVEANIRPDLCITAAYGQYLPKRFLASPTYGTVNIHPSLLPRWRGASPVQRSLEMGDNPVGVSVLFTVSKMDAGPIIAQSEQVIGDNDQATTVLPLLFNIGTKSLIEVLPDLLDGKITMETATPQDDALVVEARMIDAAEAELKVWQESALTCHNRVRGFSMWPGTFCYLQVEGEEPIKCKIVETRLFDERVNPTRVIEIGPSKQDGLRLVCGDGSVLEIMKLQPVTRYVMDAKSFINGLRGRALSWVETPMVAEAVGA
jgi:methionyl-tRNA formyltransferase